MRQSDALRLVNKCRWMYPELDFTNIVLADGNNYEYRFGSESAGICTGSGDIYVRIPVEEYFPKLSYSSFMGTLLHEAIHRYVVFTYGIKHHGHGEKFQETCLRFGLDPIKESAHDDSVESHIYPMDEKDYRKYRDIDGDLPDPRAETDAEYAMWDKHEKTYNRKCPAYSRHEEAVRDMLIVRQWNEKRDARIQAILDAA